MRNWEPPFTFEEKLKYTFIPPRIYYPLYAYWKLWRGEPELKLLPYLIDRERNAVDAGANRGSYTYWLQRYSKHVYAYEPNPKIYRLLDASAKGNVTVRPIGLSNQSSSAELRVPKRKGNFSNQGASLNYKNIASNYGCVKVETRRLDDEHLVNIGFMKIDVEGHEFEVLEGACHLIQRDKPILLIEVEEKHTKIPIEESLLRIMAMGYSGFALFEGVFKSVSFFNPECHHRSPKSREQYIFNFIFLPS